MALRRQESFDNIDTATRAAKGWTFSVAGASPGDEGCTIGAYGRNSTQGLRGRNGSVSGNSTRAVLGIAAASGATAILGVAFRINTAIPAGTIPVLKILRDSTVLITVECTSTGTLRVVRGDQGGTVLSTSVSTITHSTYYFAEIKVTLDDSTGSYELRIDGVNYTSGSGLDTLVSGAATWNGIGLGGTWAGLNWTIDFDDLYVCDGSGGVEDDFLGDHRQVYCVRDTGNGSNDDWARSTGADTGALLDEIPPNETDYVISGTVGHRTTGSLAAVGVTGTVKAVQHNNYLWAQVAGVRSAGPTVRIGGVNYDASGQAVGSTPSMQLAIERVSPATSSAWTISEIDGAEFGAKVTA